MPEGKGGYAAKPNQTREFSLGLSQKTENKLVHGVVMLQAGTAENSVKLTKPIGIV